MMLLHQGQSLAPHDLAGAWTLDPFFSVPLAVSGLMYWRGAVILARRTTRNAAGLRRERKFFAAGWALLALALFSPVHAAGETLFSAHMIQHELMMALAAPLIVLGRPEIRMIWSITHDGHIPVRLLARAGAWSTAWRALTQPFIAMLVHGAAIWIWHVPRFYDASVTSDMAHAAQHLSFLSTALLFWWSVLRPGLRREKAGLAVLTLFITAIHTGLLGVLLAVSDFPMYSAYTDEAVSRWGMTRLEDQQLGGIIMWVPASFAYAVAALAAFLRWIGSLGAGVRKFSAWPGDAAGEARQVRGAESGP